MTDAKMITLSVGFDSISEQNSKTQKPSNGATAVAIKLSFNNYSNYPKEKAPKASNK